MGMLPTYPGTDWPEVREKQLAELEPSLRTMQRLGFSAATGGAGKDLKVLLRICYLHLTAFIMYRSGMPDCRWAKCSERIAG